MTHNSQTPDVIIALMISLSIVIIILANIIPGPYAIGLIIFTIAVLMTYITCLFNKATSNRKLRGQGNPA